MLHMSHMWMPYIPLCAISDPTIRIKMILKKKWLKLFHIEKSRMSYQTDITPNTVLLASLYFSGSLLFLFLSWCFTRLKLFSEDWQVTNIFAKLVADPVSVVFTRIPEGKQLMKLLKNFCSSRWGSLLPMFAQAYHIHSPPHRCERKLFAAYDCKVTFKHLPQPSKLLSVRLYTLQEFLG